MIKPLIGITTKLDKTGNLPRVVLLENYTRSILRAGGIPVLLPVGLQPESAASLCARLDGILLSGGGDIDPRHYNGIRHDLTDGIDPERDAFELALVREATATGSPLFGICRGLQVINVAMGGSLCQHIPDQYGDRIHHQSKVFSQYIHSVAIRSGTRFAGFVDRQELKVNSLHHQGIDRLAGGFEVTAVAGDGLIEGIESRNGAFMAGVQWHPEALHEDPAAAAIFQGFTRAAARHHESRK